jgi:hypothetical protein
MLYNNVCFRRAKFNLLSYLPEIERVDLEKDLSENERTYFKQKNSS